uniref:Protein S100 n=1 Tax=Mola mola TaxID=94237 RepID=A0A3Q4AKM9_MOLML
LPCPLQYPPMKLIKDTFDKYAGKEGDKDTLTKKEVVALLQTEFPEADVSRKATNQAAMDKFFNNLDNDRDGVVSFEEFVTFVAALSSLHG